MVKIVSNSVTLVWLRQDLRLDDQPALAAALATGGRVVPVYIWAPDEEGAWAPGAASRWWLHHALVDLDGQLRARGLRLILCAGPTREALLALARETGAARVFWSRRYEPAVRRRDDAVLAVLRGAGLEAREFSGTLLFEPEKIFNRSGKPFQVFSAFWRHCLALRTPTVGKPLSKDLSGVSPQRWPTSVALDSLNLQPEKKWDEGFYSAWDPTMAGAGRRLKKFSMEALARYAVERDWPARDGSSRMSPYLHFGQISPRQAWVAGASSSKFQAELGWREFAHYLLCHFPQLPEKPLRAEFARFPWVKNKKLLRAWQMGQTGYPLVDAGMRQLWQTGWMHNRVRMVAASFLVKHLGQPWTCGAAWFWDTLVDADLASNSMGWQWVAGCGADAAPYFRVFNPTLQGERFDPAGDYIRQYVPELARVPAAFIHAPERAPRKVLEAAGVEMGKNYPRPVVEHVASRRRALQDYQKMRKGL